MKNNVDKYLMILDELSRNPNAIMTQVCKKFGVKYQGFQAWNARNKKTVVTPGAPAQRRYAGHSEPAPFEKRASVNLELEVLAKAILDKNPTIAFSVTEIVNGLDPVEIHRLDALMGARTRTELLAAAPSGMNVPIADGKGEEEEQDVAEVGNVRI